MEYYAAVSQRLQDLERNKPKVTGQLREEGAPLKAPIMDLMLEYRTRINQIREHYSPFVARFPGQPHEVGARSEDHSDWGGYDVNMNAPEACLGWAKNYGFTVKPRPAGQDPFISILKIIRVRASINKTPTALGAVHD